jgi:hypothetical protein
VTGSKSPHDSILPDILTAEDSSIWRPLSSRRRPNDWLSTVLIRRWLVHILRATVLAPGADPHEIDRTAHARYDWEHRRPSARRKTWQGSQPQAAPITKHKQEKLPKLCLAHPVTRCIPQIPSCSHHMWRAYAGDGEIPRTLCAWLLRDIVSMHSLDILSSHARDMWLSAFVAVMFTRR